MNNNSGKNIPKMGENQKTRKKHPILWTSKSISILNEIMDQINESKLLKPLGLMVRYYLNKYEKGTENKISLVGDLQTEIPEETLILATICNIYLQRTTTNIRFVLSSRLIYKTLGRIIYIIIDDNFRYDSWPLNYGENYMINFLTELIMPQKTNLNREIVKSSYFITRYIMKYISNNLNLLLYTETLFTHANSIDISFLTHQQIREFLSVLKTKRRLYLRVFLTIINHMSKYNTIINNRWTKKMVQIYNADDFKEMLSDDVMEIIISITGFDLMEL